MCISPIRWLHGGSTHPCSPLRGAATKAALGKSGLGYHGSDLLSKSPRTPDRIGWALALVLAVVLTLAACGTSAPPREERSWLPVPGRDRPAGAPAAAAATPKPPTAAPAPSVAPISPAIAPTRTEASAPPEPTNALERVEARLRTAVAKAAAGRALLTDRAVDAACRGTAAELTRVRDRSAAVSHLRRWLFDEQVSDAVYLPLTVELGLEEAPPAELLNFVETELQARGVTHVGVGAAQLDDGRVLAVVVALRRLTELSAFPRQVTGGGSQLLWVKSLAEVPGVPRVLASDPAGQIREVPTAGPQRGDGAVPFDVSFPGGPGRYLVQVLAEDRHGTQVANLLEVWRDQAPTRVVRVPPPPLEARDETAQEAYLLDALNRFRLRQGLTPLALDERLTFAARRHSAEMAERRFFGHVSPVRGGLPERLEEARLGGRYARENIAMSVSAVWAHESLIESPSHRSAMLDPKVSHVGIGVARKHSGGLEVIYVTQISAELGAAR